MGTPHATTVIHPPAFHGGSGILPLVFANPTDYDRLALEDKLSLAGIKASLSAGTETLDLVCATPGNAFTVQVRLTLTDRQRRILIAGGLLNLER